MVIGQRDEDTILLAEKRSLFDENSNYKIYQ